jgi:hypothetical protein
MSNIPENIVIKAGVTTRASVVNFGSVLSAQLLNNIDAKVSTIARNKPPKTSKK